MNLKVAEWRYLYELSEHPDRIAASRDLFPDETQDVETSLFKKELLLLEGEDIRLTDQGAEFVDQMRAKAGPLLRGIPIEERNPATIKGRAVLSHYGTRPWFSTRMPKNTPCILPPDAGALFPGGKTLLPKKMQKELREVSDADRKLIQEFVKHAAGMKTLIEIKPYAYQLGSIGGEQLIVLQSDDLKLVLPVQAHFYDWMTFRFTDPVFLSSPEIDNPIPVLVKTGKGPKGASVFGYRAVIMAVHSTPTWTWQPPSL